MINLNSPLRKNLFYLNAVAIIFYIYIVANFNVTDYKQLCFSTNDSQTYFDVINWFISGIRNESIGLRPIFYPALLFLFSKFGGVYGIWFFQFIFWLLSINFIFLAIRNYTKNYLFSYFGAVIIVSNLSLISISLHALTEVTTVFLLSILIYYIVKNSEKFREISFFLNCLLITVLLTITKPVFAIPLYCMLVILPIFYFKQFYERPKFLLKLLLIISPLMIQLAIVKINFGETKVSLISAKTYDLYIFSQGMAEIENFSIEKARFKIYKMSSIEKSDYLKDHFSVYFEIFKRNITENIKGEATFLFYKFNSKNVGFFNFMKRYNENTLIWHFRFIALFVFFSIFLLFKKCYHLFFTFGFLYVLGFYFIIATGISFWQGDRLTLAALPLWACLYPIILFQSFQFISEKFTFLKKIKSFNLNSIFKTKSN